MSETPEARMIEPERLSQWIADGEALVVDVREAHEFAQARIAGSFHLPLSAFDPTTIPEVANKKLVLHCHSGVRCGVAAARLAELGWRDMYRLRGGIVAWAAAGQPIER